MEIRPVRKHFQYFLMKVDTAGEVFPRFWAPGGRSAPCAVLRNTKEYEGISWNTERWAPGDPQSRVQLGRRKHFRGSLKEIPMEISLSPSGSSFYCEGFLSESARWGRMPNIFLWKSTRRREYFQGSGLRGTLRALRSTAKY